MALLRNMLVVDRPSNRECYGAGATGGPPSSTRQRSTTSSRRPSTSLLAPCFQFDELVGELFSLGRGHAAGRCWRA
eukprot:3340463-Pyramimonas_sp.AAC.1